MSHIKNIATAVALTTSALTAPTLAAEVVIPQGTRVITIDHPKMTVYLPSKETSTGRAVVGLPGGGYRKLATGHEGTDWIPYYNNLGIAYAVVEYTLPAGNRALPYDDAVAAMKVMRDSAETWGINPHDIGIMGSSAGGHLASTVATRADSTARPDFQILFYPVISMKSKLTHQGSREHLLGQHPSSELVKEYCNELNVTAATPPAILLLSDDDKTVSPLNSIRYYEALHSAGVPASMVIYPTGGHGWGFHRSFTYHDAMLTQLTSWLRNLK